MKYDLAIFDMDGTVLDTLRDLADSINYALRSCGLPERTTDEVRQFVGNGRRVLTEKASPSGTPEEVLRRVYAAQDIYYRDHCRDHARPYDGIPELLSGMRASGMKTAVSSNKAHTEVISLAESFFPGLFDMALGDREGARRKPAPDSVLEIMRTLGVTPARTVYIGDSDVDIMTANNAGVDIISVCWGFRDEDFLREHGAVTLARTPIQVRELVLGR